MTDPIAIHYSQASMRTEWMLARRPEGDKWIDRNARIERTDDEFLRLRESWCQLIEDQGMQYNFVSYEQMENGELLKSGYRVLVLPRSSSLSTAEADGDSRFVAQGGTVIADGSLVHSTSTAAGSRSPAWPIFSGRRMRSRSRLAISAKARRFP